MELVYLWVEDYKNIKKQGFNFSPRFRCEYNDKTNELTIKENENYIDIFPDNINITAIVGKNGSGKSNLSECIAFDHYTTLHNRKAILFLYYDKVNNKFFEYSRKIEKTNFKKFRVYNLDDEFNYRYYPNELAFQDRKNKINLFKIFFTSGKIWFDPIRERNQKNLKQTIYEMDISDYTLFEWYAQKIQMEYNHRLTSFTQIWHFSKIQNTLNRLKLFKPHIKFPKDLLKPKSLYINLDTSFIQTSYINFIQNKFGDKYKGILIDLLNLVDNPYVRNIEYNEYKLKYILVLNLIILMDLNESDIKVDFEGLGFNKYKNKDIEWYMKKIDEGWNSIKKKAKEYKLDRLIELLSKEEFDIKKDFEDIQETLDIYKTFLDDGKIDFLKLWYKPFLSSGGEQIINLIARVYIQIEENIKMDFNNKVLILILDEPDIYLHPNWQKQFIKILIDFLEKNYKDIKFHIIFTTHSPFLISDLPKENIIFLDTDKKGNCKVLSHDKVLSKKQTFGANIHTLLSDNFFMEDGLMGEFAKSKIDEIREFYQKVIEEKKTNENIEFYNKNRDRFWQIQSIIGEPFLQRVIKNYLEEIELVLLGKSEAIDNEIARLMAIKKSLKND